MSTLLLESGAAPAQPVLHPKCRCPECEGDGVIERRDCHHLGLCPCGGVEVECGACDGSGRVACEHCGEPAEIRYLGQTLCLPCAPAEEFRFSGCAICDRPIDVCEVRVPLCPSCEGTARVAGEQAAEAARYERERRAS